MFLQNAQTLSGLPLIHYHKHTADLLQHIIKVTTTQIKVIVDVVSDFYKAEFKNNINDARKEF